MTERHLKFVLPDGAVAPVSTAQAQRIADALWELAFAPGAVMAAARITEAMRKRGDWQRVTFTEREQQPLLDAAHDALQWTGGNQPAH
jgi:hypothetical protein